MLWPTRIAALPTTDKGPDFTTDINYLDQFNKPITLIGLSLDYTRITDMSSFDYLNRLNFLSLKWRSDPGYKANWRPR